MTIYKPNNPERKQEKTPMVASDVVVSDKQPLTDKASGNDVLLLVRRRPVTNMDVLRRRRRIRCAVVALLMLLVIASALVVALLFNHRSLSRPYIGECDVSFHEQNKLMQRDGQSGRQESYDDGMHKGVFKEMFEIDQILYTYEKLEVPPVLDFRRSTVVHDFKENLSAIIDREKRHCFIMPLNRTVVQPPKNFMDLINKVKAGYYVPDAEIIRENYVVVFPPISNVDHLGFQIWNDCQNFDTYRLVRGSTPQPSTLVKRSADCSLIGDRFCMGMSGVNTMSCFTISGCRI